MATAITTTAQNITGDFDLVVRGTPESMTTITLMKSLGSTTTNWAIVETLSCPFNGFVKNTGTNSYKLGASVSGLTVEFQQ